MVFHVTELVQLAASQHRVVEHVQDRPPQRLGTVQDGEDRLGDVQAPLPD